MNKREICTVLADGKPRTILEIASITGHASDVAAINAARTVMGRLFKEGRACEVQPRRGREKLWMNAPAAAALVNKDMKRVIRGDTIQYWSTSQPDQFIFAKKPVPR